MRYCQIYDFRVLGRITLRQYTLIMQAVRLQKLDEERNLHWQAWLNQAAKSTIKKGSGKNAKIAPKFKTFDAFFDYSEAEDKIKGKTKQPEDNGFKALLAKANKKEGGT